MKQITEQSCLRDTSPITALHYVTTPGTYRESQIKKLHLFILCTNVFQLDFAVKTPSLHLAAYGPNQTFSEQGSFCVDTNGGCSLCVEINYAPSVFPQTHGVTGRERNIRQFCSQSCFWAWTPCESVFYPHSTVSASIVLY